MGIHLIPLRVIWPDGTQNPDTDFHGKPEAFYKKMAFFKSQRKRLPTTSAPNQSEFTEFYNQLYEEGIREVVSVHLARGKSGTYDHALIGAIRAIKQHPDLSVKVVDSGTLSLAQLFLASSAVEMLKQGLPLGKVKKGVIDQIPKTTLRASISSLENLKASGRIPKAAALVGSVLKISILVEVKDGEIDVWGKTMGAVKGRNLIADRLRADIEERGNPARLGIIYTGDPAIGEELKNTLSDVWQGDHVELLGPLEAGPILGVHAGPGTGGIAAFWK